MICLWIRCAHPCVCVKRRVAPASPPAARSALVRRTGTVAVARVGGSSRSPCAHACERAVRDHRVWARSASVWLARQSCRTEAGAAGGAACIRCPWPRWRRNSVMPPLWARPRPRCSPLVDTWHWLRAARAPQARRRTAHHVRRNRAALPHASALQRAVCVFLVHFVSLAAVPVLPMPHSHRSRVCGAASDCAPDHVAHRYTELSIQRWRRFKRASGACGGRHHPWRRVCVARGAQWLHRVRPTQPRAQPTRVTARQPVAHRTHVTQSAPAAAAWTAYGAASHRVAVCAAAVQGF